LVKGYPFEVAIPSGLKISGVILADQVKSLDWRAEFICKLPQEAAGEVTGKLATFHSPSRFPFTFLAHSDHLIDQFSL
jgi:mRNA-degrading endonuclease toxin of MazEF toxin-antitoxin module